jgi:hypothetical protein
MSGSLAWPMILVYHADPLTCRTCGGPLQIVAYIHDHFTIKRILDHLGLSPPEIEGRLLTSAMSPSITRDESSRAWWPRDCTHPSRARRLEGPAGVCRRPLGQAPSGAPRAGRGEG